MGHSRLAESEDGLTRLAGDLDEMQQYLERAVGRMNGLVDKAAKGWQSPAAAAYESVQASVNEDAARVRQMLVFIEEAVRMSRDGFSAQELHTLEEFKKVQTLGDEGMPSLPTDPGSGDGGSPRSTLADL